jgi:threonine dehydrogenase-like Zn-dependent dehydrogenase
MVDFEQAFEWLVSGQASLGELPPVRPLEDGPAAFAALASGPPPSEVKVFLSPAGREPG